MNRMSLTCTGTTSSLSSQKSRFTEAQNNLPYAHFEIHSLQSITGQKLLAGRAATKIRNLEVICITKGDGELIVDLNTYQFSNGTVYCLFPGQLRCIKPSSQLDGYYISASADFIYLSQTFSDLVVNSHSFQSALDPLEVKIDEELGSEINEVLVKLRREYENYFLVTLRNLIWSL
jgi:AraC family transcriptional regulator, transcriptional activator of pobA